MIVKNVRFINNKVEIVLEDKIFYISKENYIDNPITIDSNIDDKKINYLLDYEKVIESKFYMIKLLNKRALSEYEVYSKLKERDLNDQFIKAIMESLKRAGLINDEFVAVINMESLLLKRKGKKEIRESLKEKRIKGEIIDKVMEQIDENLYVSNFNKVVDKYSKMYDKKSFKVKEALLKQKLEELGYERELILGVTLESNCDKELELAKSALIKIIKNKNIDLNNYENINKIKSKMLMKGFSYDIINLAFEGVKNNETH
jgi:SOS response regulatory protein OraA/RecX